MAIGSDRVQVQKSESVAGGGDASDEFFAPSTIDELTDALSSAGIYFQDGGETQTQPDETVGLARDGSGRLCLFDQENPYPGACLTELKAADMMWDNEGRLVLDDGCLLVTVA